MKKLSIALVLAIPLAVVVMGIRSMTQGDIEDVVICSTNESSHHMPSSVCEYYLFNHRVTEADIEFLERGAGLAFLFDIQNKEERNRRVAHFIEQGASLDKPSPIDGFPPLHAAILYNDLELVEMLVEKGADLEQADRHHDLTPLEFAEFLSRRNEETDRGAILLVLSSATESALEPDTE